MRRLIVQPSKIIRQAVVVTMEAEAGADTEYESLGARNLSIICNFKDLEIVT